MDGVDSSRVPCSGCGTMLPIMALHQPRTLAPDLYPLDAHTAAQYSACSIEGHSGYPISGHGPAFDARCTTRTLLARALAQSRTTCKRAMRRLSAGSGNAYVKHSPRAACKLGAIRRCGRAGSR